MNPAAVGLPSILTIEDDPVLGAYVHEHLGRCGFEVTWCRNGQQGLQLARDQAFDLVLMDVLLPGLDGLSVLTHLRQSHASMIELRVRIEAILRRVALDRRPPPGLAPLRDDAQVLRFDDELCDVVYHTHWASLTRSEYRLLETLHRNPDEVLSKAFLYQHVLQRGYAPHDRSLDMHVSQIRRKLKAIGYTEREVRTVWGKGYMLSGHDEGL
jgi:two-component system response regulator PfeR